MYSPTANVDVTKRCQGGYRGKVSGMRGEAKVIRKSSQRVLPRAETYVAIVNARDARRADIVF